MSAIAVVVDVDGTLVDDEALRRTVDPLLADLDEGPRRSIDFLLRTAG